MMKEVPTEKHILEFASKEGQPLGFRVFSDLEETKKFAEEILIDKANQQQGIRVFLRKWEGVELVLVESEH